MSYLIVGLGNPGEEYQHTRHNVGFDLLDVLAKTEGSSFDAQPLGLVSQFRLRGRKVVLLKPSTYVNLSGKAVYHWLHREKIPLDHLLVVTDDIALPFGKLRMKGKGSDGGHNGLKHINAILNTSAYARLRFGIGRDFGRGRQAEYVLGKWGEEEQLQLKKRLEIGIEFVKGFVTIGLEHTMNQWNNR